MKDAVLPAGYMLDRPMRTAHFASSTRSGSTVTRKGSSAPLKGGSCICTSTSNGNATGVDVWGTTAILLGLCCVCMCVSCFVLPAEWPRCLCAGDCRKFISSCDNVLAWKPEVLLQCEFAVNRYIYPCLAVTSTPIS